MRIVPAIDLLSQQVVRGVAGRREQYRPIESLLCENAEPAVVARALVEKLGLRGAYLADLDAIAGDEPAWDVYRQMAEAGLALWVDAGLTDIERTRAVAMFEAGERPLAAVIAGLETVGDETLLAAMLDVVGPERFVFSLDLKQGRPLTDSPGWRGMTVEQIAAAALGIGVRRFVILDLARVGMGAGVGTESLCRQLRQMAPEAEIVAGGGIRSAEDLNTLARAGCNAALVATALHDGTLGGQARD